VLDCRFRHFAPGPVELRPGISGRFNLGFRLYDAASRALLFEDRMEPDEHLIEPGRWVAGRLQIPRKALPFGRPAELMVDMVKEDEYWFAASPQQAQRFKFSFGDGTALIEPSSFPETELPVETAGESEVRALVEGEPDNGHGLPARPGNGAAGNGVRPLFDQPTKFLLFERRPYTPPPPAPEFPPLRSMAAESRARYHLVFDVSDLVQYFQNARLPTGIQRVQMEIVTSLIFALPADYSLRVACFTTRTDFWAEVPPLFFHRLCALALADGDPDAPDWRQAVEELNRRVDQGPMLAFPTGAFLINLGTSWWLKNYFLNVRLAKARYGVRYVPFVHDCIPIITPEHCTAGLTRDFISWAIGVFQHADHVLVNSQATAVDFVRVARYLGHATTEPAIVRLDAEYGRPAAATRPSLQSNEIFLRNDLRPGDYVLFVATIESRKNHVLVFAAWLALVKKYGALRVPKLVCVGNRGWLDEAIYAKLAASSLLQQKVVMLSKIPDADLERLYRNCLFTLFPSSYEGWGLPVTESLCCGKVPLVSDCSSLPEAGGEFAEYFTLGSEAELVRKLEQLIFEPGYREAREQKIAAEFRPRSWATIAAEVLALMRRWSDAAGAAIRRPAEGTAGDDIWPLPATPGRYYGLTENTETQIWPGMASGEMFRQGSRWWWPEPWGTWTKPGVARLAFLAPFAAGSSAMLYLCVRGVQGLRSTITVTLSGIGTRQFPLDPDQDQWVLFRIPPDALARLQAGRKQPLFDVLFSADQVADFRATTNGADHRQAALGVRGFMVCAEDDMRARMRVFESVLLDDFAGLEERPIQAGALLA
jgi:glycosyltransferase involved in cell wall biosynthesis